MTLRATLATSSSPGRWERMAQVCPCSCFSCDLLLHGPEVGPCKCLIEDGLDAIFAERAHQRVGRGDLPQSIDDRGPVEVTSPHQQCEPPALPPIFGELGVGDGAPGLNKLVVLQHGGGHAAAPRALALAKAMMREWTKLVTSGVGVNAVRSQSLSGSCPNLSRNRYQAQPGFFTTAKRFADQHLIPVS